MHFDESTDGSDKCAAIDWCRMHANFSPHLSAYDWLSKVYSSWLDQIEGWSLRRSLLSVQKLSSGKRRTWDDSTDRHTYMHLYTDATCYDNSRVTLTLDRYNVRFCSNLTEVATELKMLDWTRHDTTQQTDVHAPVYRHNKSAYVCRCKFL